MILGSKSNAVLESALRGLWQRQRAILHNIANEDTPGFRAKRVEFESILQREIISARRDGLSKRDSVRRLGTVAPMEYEQGGTPGRADGNNVDIDSEYLELARVQIQYEAVQQRINGYYSNLRYVITGGR
jgi:flagellar basal-body rod protein FlgB